MDNDDLLPTSGNIELLIQHIRGKRVILDVDRASLYGTSTKRLNQAVKRNRNKFPDDFMFRLSGPEKEELVTNCDQFNNLKHLPGEPLAFTEHGAIQAANVLNSGLRCASATDDPTGSSSSAHWILEEEF